jgi:hypothetical protein
MTGISLHMQWLLTSQSHGRSQIAFLVSDFIDIHMVNITVQCFRKKQDSFSVYVHINAFDTCLDSTIEVYCNEDSKNYCYYWVE